MIPTRVDELRGRITELHDQLEQELVDARKRWAYTIEAGRVRFDRDVQLAHKRFKQSIPAFIRDSRPLNIVAAPVVYSMLVPIAMLDVWVSVFHFICFPLFGISKVRRADYIVIDRHKLSYLNTIEKLNCVYCGYANGVFAYVREITSRTEQYWCPIKHARRLRGPHPRYHDFVEYGDADGYKRRLPVLRQQLRRP